MIFTGRAIRSSVFLLAFCVGPFGLPALAGEYAVLASGFRLRVERHEEAGSVVRLYSGQGVTELDASKVIGFEADDYVPPPPPASPVQRGAALSPHQMVTRAALQSGLPPEFLHSVAAAESGYRVDATSRKGAVGIMQLMPGTAEELGADPGDPEQNTRAGAKYLRQLLLKYKDDPLQVRKALAGYNAGPGAVDRYNGVPPYPETQQYVERVLHRYQRLKSK